MNPKWIIGMVTLWITLGVLGGVIEKAYLGADEVSKLEILMTPLLADSFVEGLLRMAQAVITLSWWSTILGMLMFDFAMFTGVWVIVQLILFIPLAIAITISLMLAVIRGVGS